MIALVTGASGGIGSALSHELARDGHDIVLVAKQHEQLEQLCDELTRLYPKQMFVSYVIDLARTEAAEELYEWCSKQNYNIDTLINNAGVFAYCDLMKMEVKRIEELLLLHIVTLTKCCRLFGEAMAERGEGYILNLSSYSQWMPYPGMSLYGASKAYVRSFSIAFSREVGERGVRVTCVAPAGVATDLYGLNPSFQRLGMRLGVLISPKRCARRSLSAMWRGRRSSIPDWWNWLFIPLCKHLPDFIIRLIRRYTLRFQR